MATEKNEKYLFPGLNFNSDELKKSVMYLRSVKDSNTHSRIGDIPSNKGELIEMHILNMLF